MEEAENAALDELVEIPRRATDRFYAAVRSTDYNYEQTSGEDVSMNGRRTRRTNRAVRRYAPAARTSLSGAEQRIINLVENYLDRIPSGGATLNALVDHVVLDTDYDSSIVRSVIERHFVVVGPVVTNRCVVDTETRANTVSGWMADVLRERGYQDLREDVELTGVPDLNEKAELIAFDGAEPLVLCYPVNDYEVENPSYHEAAKFQAGVVAPGKMARIAWVSDGHSNFIFDMTLDRVLARLPRKDELLPQTVVPPVAAPERERSGRSRGGAEPSA